MTTKFYGDLRGLKRWVSNCGVRGIWRHVAPSGLHQFKAETGEYLNWWPTTGTITFQGGDIPVLQDHYERQYLPREVRRSSAARDERSAWSQAGRSRGEPRSRVRGPSPAPRRPKRRDD